MRNRAPLAFLSALIVFGVANNSFGWYDPSVGRWLNRDPAGESGGLNLYAYCLNDPVNRFDPLGLSPSLIFINCDDPQKGILRQAVAEATRYANEGQSALVQLSDAKTAAKDKRYMKWFGCPTDKRLRTLKANWQKLVNAFQTGTIKLKNEPKNPDFGVVIPGFGIVIRVGGSFWAAPMTGTNSKAGTLIHEMSHEVSGTKDFTYGTANAQNLAKKNPEKAIRNADNWEFFVEVK